MAGKSACKGCGELLSWDYGSRPFEVRSMQPHQCPNYQALKNRSTVPVQQRLSPVDINDYLAEVDPPVRVTPPASPDDYEVLRALNRIEALLKELVRLNERSLV